MAALGGSVKTGLLIAGRAPISFGSDANKTLSAAIDYENTVLDVTSSATLTATRNLVIAVPVDGAIYVVRNNTTGGQSIQLIGPAGTGITVATGKTAVCLYDGTNFVRLTADV